MEMTTRRKMSDQGEIVNEPYVCAFKRLPRCRGATTCTDAKERRRDPLERSRGQILSELAISGYIVEIGQCISANGRHLRQRSRTPVVVMCGPVP